MESKPAEPSIPPNSQGYANVLSFRLKDPFLDLNEIKAEWVATKSWTYRTKLHVPQFASSAKVILSFGGLDTFAKVSLNDKVILRADNMFTPQRVDITNLVEANHEYELDIEFEPALAKGEEIRKENPGHKWLDFVGETSRPAVRKAQYHWGWDWGPVMPCAGIWRPVHLEIYHGRISDICPEVNLSPKMDFAQIKVTTTCETTSGENHFVEISLLSNGIVISEKSNIPLQQGKALATLTVDNPLLWMPAGYGSQPLYDVKVKLLSSDKTLAEDGRRIGIRRTELIQEPDDHGKSFYFRVNDVDIFCGGACWIPTDSFLTNIDPRRYRRWIELMVAGNQNMIR